MAPRFARTPLAFVVALLWTSAARAADERVVYLGGDLSPQALTVFTTAVEASGQGGLVLLDAKSSTYTRAFLQAYAPAHVVPVGSFPAGVADVERRLKVKALPAVPCERGPPHELWKVLFPRAERVVVCPAEPRGLFLHAACLAGALRAPLYVVTKDQAADDLRQAVNRWQTREVVAVAAADAVCRDLPGVRVTRLADEAAVVNAYLDEQAKRGPVTALVVANPADVCEEYGGMSALAPWVALQHRAALLLTNQEGDNVEDLVRAALRDRRLQGADAVLLVAGLHAVPTRRRPNPVAGDKDPFIEMEPLTPAGDEPFSFAVGRLFNDDPSVVIAQLARRRLLAESRGPRKALVASNAGASLPLLEAFSRNTAQEFQNAGYETTARFGREVTKDELRRLMPGHDIVLWEGHHNTLIRDWEMPAWDEPLAPALVFLQSCLALTDAKAQPLIHRGAVGVVGSSTRTYSASGGAFSLAFFDALLYDGQPLGGALRQAKNFLLAYSLLKDKRLGDEARRTGANRRAAWAFTLWGDPTLTLPRPERPADTLAPVRHEVKGSTITLTVPDKAYDRVRSAKYQVRMPPNGRLAGLLRKDDEDDARPLVPFLFAEVHLPEAPAGKEPRLSGKLPSGRYVFLWDARRRCGYLLAEPRAEDKELRFHVAWGAAE